MPNIEIDGIDVLVTTAGRLTASKYLENPMIESLTILQGELATYPPPRSATYNRTGDLGTAWWNRPKISFGANLGFSVTGTLANQMEYGPYVQGEEEQAAVHAGHWKTDKDILDQEESRIQDIFEKAINKAMMETMGR